MDKRNDKKPFGRKPVDRKGAAGKGFGKKLFEKKPFEKKPFERKSADGGASGRRSFEGKPDGERKFDRKPFEKRADGERRFGRKPFEGSAGGERSFEKKPLERKPFDSARPEGRRERALGNVGYVDNAARAAQGDARRVALNALIDVNRFDAYASLALDKRLRESRLSSDDRRLATSIFYAAVENRLNIEYVLSSFLNTKPDQIVEDILHIACAQILFLDKIPAHAAVDEAVKMTRAYKKDEASGFVNGVMRNLLRAIEAGSLAYPDPETEPVKALSIRYSVPEALVNRLIDAYGFETASEIVAFRPKERLETIRPNLMRMDENAFEEYLNRRGWDWRRGVTKGAYLIAHAGNLAGDPDFYEGLFSIQGESSMLSARAVQARPGMTIVDACAAPGGKSALMCEMMNGTGRVHAWDVHAHRVELIKAAGKRLKLDNLRPAVRDASVCKEDLQGAIDAVLIDAPCSGVGVMTDKPDLKYRVSDESIDSLVETQKRILKACAPYVKRGGLLVYSTCSILPEENEKQIEAFLMDHPEFKRDENYDWVPDTLKARANGGMLSLLPVRDGVEGFFIARLRRVNL